MVVILASMFFYVVSTVLKKSLTLLLICAANFSCENIPPAVEVCDCLSVIEVIFLSRLDIPGLDRAFLSVRKYNHDIN